MKKMIRTILPIIFLWVISVSGVFCQKKDEINVNVGKKGINIRFENKKKKGYYNTTQISMLMGNRQVTDQYPYYPYYPYYGILSYSSLYVTPYYRSNIRTELQVSPSITMTNGYMFNEHWAIGAGVGFEIFECNQFPVFADIRYVLWDNKVSPYFAVKTGYAFGNFKNKRYDDDYLILNYEPYYVSNADFRNYGGFMLNPEMGVKVPLSENADLLFTVAYRLQKIKTKITQSYDSSGYNEWEHNESLNRLSFGVAVMFR